VAEFSIDIRNACMLINSFDARFGCSKEILMLVSMLEVQGELFAGQGLGILKGKKKVGAKEGDFLTLINFFLRFHHAGPSDRKRICGEYKLRHSSMEQALRIYDELLAQIKRFNRFKSAEEEMEYKFSEGGEERRRVYEVKSSLDEQEAILRCILTGYFTNIAQLQGDGSYLNIRSK
jgi:ATP-dependent RNA helicase DDX35